MRAFPILACLVLAGAAHAQDAAEGAAYFADHCATCHGPTGKGDGPMASVLSVRPADLTALSAGNGDVFPTDRVIRRIDGTTEVLAHGGPMPIFGMLLGGPSGIILAPDGSEVVSSEAIVDVAAFLESLQE